MIDTSIILCGALVLFLLIMEIIMHSTVKDLSDRVDILSAKLVKLYDMSIEREKVLIDIHKALIQNELRYQDIEKRLKRAEKYIDDDSESGNWWKRDDA